MAWQVARCRRKQGAISGAKLRPRHLAPQDRELVAQDEQLDVLDVQAAATPNKRAQQGPEREVEKREGTVADPPNPPAKGATRVMAPFRRGSERRPELGIALEEGTYLRLATEGGPFCGEASPRAGRQ